MFLISSVTKLMQLRKTVFFKYISKNVLRFVHKIRLGRGKQHTTMNALPLHSLSSFAGRRDRSSEKGLSLAEIYSRSASYFYSSDSLLFSGNQQGYGKDCPVLE